MRLRHWILIGALAGTALAGAGVPTASGQSGTPDVRGAHVRIVIDFDRGSISFSGQLDTMPMSAARQDVRSLRDRAHQVLVAARAVSRGLRHAVRQLLAGDDAPDNASHTVVGEDQPSC